MSNHLIEVIEAAVARDDATFEFTGSVALYVTVRLSLTLQEVEAQVESSYEVHREESDEQFYDRIIVEGGPADDEVEFELIAKAERSATAMDIHQLVDVSDDYEVLEVDAVDVSELEKV
jgi:hypothetical protein